MRVGQGGKEWVRVGGSGIFFKVWEEGEGVGENRKECEGVE